jgi:hypothetical protein
MLRHDFDAVCYQLMPPAIPRADPTRWFLMPRLLAADTAGDTAGLFDASLLLIPGCRSTRCADTASPRAEAESTLAYRCCARSTPG